MSKVHAGRMAPSIPEQGGVTFLIGMRINRIWQFWKWLPIFFTMPRMLIELAKDPSLGLIGKPRTFISGRTILVWQQWTSFEALEAYARASEHLHLPAWRAFNRRARGNPAVGIYHETYLFSPSTVEGMYVDMPPFGLGAAFGSHQPGKGMNSAAQRLGRQAPAAVGG